MANNFRSSQLLHFGDFQRYRIIQKDSAMATKKKNVESAKES